MTSRAIRYATTYTLLRVAGDVADHWLQTGRQAENKAMPGLRGHAALAAHIASYSATQLAALLAGDLLLDLDLRGRRIAAAIALSAATHYVIDRRWPIQRAAKALRKEEFHKMAPPLGGAYLLDQAAHHLAEAVAAYLAIRD